MAEQAAKKRRVYEGMGERIRERRGELALSQRALSEEAGVAVDVIVKLEHDARGPRPATLQKLAKALGVSPEYLTTGCARESDAPVTGGAPAGHGSAISEPGPPHGSAGIEPPASPGARTRPVMEVLVSGEPDEETARMLERWMDEEAAAEAAGEPDPWPEVARSLDEDRTSYRKLFER